jgi:hypothetical protein
MKHKNREHIKWKIPRKNQEEQKQKKEEKKNRKQRDEGKEN